jgi:hypothetical protein
MADADQKDVLANMGSFDLASELNEAKFYVDQGMVSEAREILLRISEMLPHHRAVKESVKYFETNTGESIHSGAGKGDGEFVDLAADLNQEFDVPQPAASNTSAPVKEAGKQNNDGDADEISGELYDAKFFYEEKMFKEALICLKRVLEIDPKNPDASALVKKIKETVKK